MLPLTVVCLLCQFHPLSVMRRSLLVVALASCALLALVSTASACSCASCGDSLSLSWLGTETFTSVACSSGYAVATAVDITSSHGFSVRGFNPANSGTSYVDITDTASVTCFNSPVGVSVGGPGYSTIAVEITCNNVLGCSLQYNIKFGCAGVTDLCSGVSCGSYGSCAAATGLCTCTDGYTGTNCETAPTTPSTGSTTVSSTGSASSSSSGIVQPAGISCACTCCTGIFCTPSLVGYASVSSCPTSGCQDTCIDSFSSFCPASGENGAIASSCKESSSGGGSSSGSGSGKKSSAIGAASTSSLLMGAMVAGAALAAATI